MFVHFLLVMWFCGYILYIIFPFWGGGGCGLSLCDMLPHWGFEIYLKINFEP